jgi:hypothetical protein
MKISPSSMLGHSTNDPTLGFLNNPCTSCWHRSLYCRCFIYGGLLHSCRLIGYLRSCWLTLAGPSEATRVHARVILI